MTSKYPIPLPHNIDELCNEVPELDVQEGRYIIRLFNQGGYDCTEMDVVHLIAWLREHKPELLQ